MDFINEGFIKRLIRITSCGYAIYCVLALMVCSFQILFVVSEDRWMWQFGAIASFAYLSFGTLFLPTIFNRRLFNEKSEKYLRRYPIIYFVALGAAVALPTLFFPNKFELWRTGALFIMMLIPGALLQLLHLFDHFAQSSPKPSKEQIAAWVEKYKWLGKFFLEKSLHAGMSKVGEIAETTTEMVSEYSPLPQPISRCFYTSEDDQEQAVLHLFWVEGEQQTLFAQFTISNIPKGKRRDTKLAVHLYIDLNRNINCEVHKPLIVERKL